MLSPRVCWDLCLFEFTDFLLFLPYFDDDLEDSIYNFSLFDVPDNNSDSRSDLGEPSFDSSEFCLFLCQSIERRTSVLLYLLSMLSWIYSIEESLLCLRFSIFVFYFNGLSWGFIFSLSSSLLYYDPLRVANDASESLYCIRFDFFCYIGF